MQRQAVEGVTSSRPSRRILDTSLFVPDHVVIRPFPNETVVINLESGQYHLLNPTAGRILELLRETQRPRETASGLAKELGQPPGRILDDLVKFTADLRQRGLVSASGSPSLRASTATPLSSTSPSPESLPHVTPLTRIEKGRLVIEILGIYLLVRMRLARTDAKILAEVTRSRKPTPNLPTEQTAAVAIYLGKAVERILLRAPDSGQCLTRSLVLVRLLARRNIASSLHIGAQIGRDHFAAHAWVEHHGIPLLGSGGQTFAPVLQIET